jgi:hypothetical protein
MAEVVRTVSMRGFDPEGEPIICVMSDGSIEVRFEFMPPSDIPEEPGLGRFAAFDRELAQAAGVPVVWEDRERFRVERPASDTIGRIRAFVEGYRQPD